MLELMGLTYPIYKLWYYAKSPLTLCQGAFCYTLINEHDLIICHDLSLRESPFH